MDGTEVQGPGGKRKEREPPPTVAVGREDDASRPEREVVAKKARADMNLTTSTTATSRAPTATTERRRDGAAHEGGEHATTTTTATATATATALLLQSERKIERETLRTIEKIVTRYHCALCRTLALQIDKPLEGLPRRRTDESYVINKDKALYKLTIVPGEKVSIKRDKGVEVQYRYQCAHCHQVVGYSSVPQHGAAQHVYILKEALVPASQVPETERRGGPGSSSWRSKEESQFLAATTKGEFTLACCSLHNKTRSVRHLERIGERWTCKAGHKCL